MRTVQLAIHDSSFARRIRELLSQDGSCDVVLAEKPDLKRDGVVLMEEDTFDALNHPVADADRFVIIASRNTLGLERMWRAGIHHVVFEGDSPGTVQLAIIAALLRNATRHEKVGSFERQWANTGIASALTGPEFTRTRPF